MPATHYLNKKIETANTKEIENLQGAELAKQLDYLFAKSLFYKDKFQAAGIRRKDYRRLSDLSRFPFTTKDALRDSQAACPPLGSHIAANLNGPMGTHSSAGTTGQPSFVGIARRDSEIWTATPSRSFYTQGL